VPNKATDGGSLTALGCGVALIKLDPSDPMIAAAPVCAFTTRDHALVVGGSCCS